MEMALLVWHRTGGCCSSDFPAMSVDKGEVRPLWWLNDWNPQNSAGKIRSHAGMDFIRQFSRVELRVCDKWILCQGLIFVSNTITNIHLSLSQLIIDRETIATGDLCAEYCKCPYVNDFAAQRVGGEGASVWQKSLGSGLHGRGENGYTVLQPHLFSNLKHWVYVLKLLISQIPEHILPPSGYMWWRSHSSCSFIWYFYRAGPTPPHLFLSKIERSRFNLTSQVSQRSTSTFFTSIIFFTGPGFCSQKVSFVAFNLFHLLLECGRIFFVCELLWSCDRKWPFLGAVFKSWLISYQMSGTCSDIQSELTFAHPAYEVLDHSLWNVSILMETFNVRSGNFNTNYFSFGKGSAHITHVRDTWQKVWQLTKLQCQISQRQTKAAEKKKTYSELKQTCIDSLWFHSEAEDDTEAIEALKSWVIALRGPDQLTHFQTLYWWWPVSSELTWSTQTHLQVKWPTVTQKTEHSPLRLGNLM